MQKITDKEKPEIILIGRDELTAIDLFKLNHVYKTDRGKFVISSRDADVIILNRDMEAIDEIKEIVEKIMDLSLTWSKREKLYARMEELAGRKAENILMDIWFVWRDTRKLADRKAEAEQLVELFRKERILQKAKKEKETLKILHNLGFGVYEKDSSCNRERGNAYCFAYGYLKALQDRG